MKHTKKVLLIGSLVIGLTSLTAYASSVYKTPAEAVAGLSGRTLEDVVTERTETGKSYGVIANEAGIFDEYKEEVLAQQKDVLDKKVSDGAITQKSADSLIKSIEANDIYCDGLGYCGNGMYGYDCIDEDEDGICDNYGMYGSRYNTNSRGNRNNQLRRGGGCCRW